VTALVLLAIAAAFVAWKLGVLALKLLLLAAIVATAVVVIPIHWGLRLVLRRP
jgi:hypothetical protein